MIDYTHVTPAALRSAIRQGILTGPTAGMCAGYAQANLVILPQELAYDFLLFCMRNPKSCPLLEVSNPGSRQLHWLANDSDLATDLPRYRIYRNGTLAAEPTSIIEYYRSDLVSFLIGCSFSFEDALIRSGIPMRHIEEHKNVPMYRTNIPCESAGIFHGTMVVSMRPIAHKDVIKAVTITGQMPRVHGTPIQIGFPEAIGIANLSSPDFGDSVTIRDGEVPVFWPCGVTPQAAIMEAKPEFVITHAPGHMFVSDLRNEDLLLR